MDEEDSDWQPCEVKLEPQIMLDAYDEKDNYLNDSYPEASCEVSMPLSPEYSPVVSGKTDLNLMNSLTSDIHSASSTSLDLQNAILNIKKERTEDEDPDSYSEAGHQVPFSIFLKQSQGVSEENDLNSMSASSTSHVVSYIMPQIKEERMEDEDSHADSCSDDLHWNPPKAAPSPPLKNDSVFSQEVNCVTRELIATNGHDISKDKYQPFEFIEMPEIKSEDFSHNITDFSPQTESKVNSSVENVESGDSSYKKGRKETEDEGTEIYNLTFSPLRQSLDESKSVPYSNDGCEIHSYTISSTSGNIMVKRTKKSTWKEHGEGPSNGSLFPGNECSADLNWVSAVKEHTLAECSTSNENRLKTGLSLKKHVLTHSDGAPCSSKQYPAQSSDESNFENGVEKETDERYLSCNQCSVRFADSSSLEKHLLTHSDKRGFSCSQCSAQFKWKAHLLRHLDTHSSVKAFACNQCSARFKRKAHLERHLVVTHSDERAFSCNQCFARFKQKSVLQQHLKTHSNVRAFSCSHCSAQYKWKASLINHLVSTHSDERAFSCSQCLAGFKLESDLEQHLRTHSEEKAFSCNQCSARFKTGLDLREHVVTHLFKKTFSCTQCSAKFESKFLLESHILTHSYSLSIFS